MLIDRSLALGGGQTPVQILQSATVKELRQEALRVCGIASTFETNLFLSKTDNLEPIGDDNQCLDAVGVSDHSLVYLSCQGTS